MSTIATRGKPRAGILPRWSPAAGTIASVAAIWVAVAITSIFSPDFITGSEQQHVPLAALTHWFWASIATAFVLVPLLARRSEAPAADGLWFVLPAATAVIWLAVVLVSLFTPLSITGSDPTQFPVGAFVSPVVGMVATGFVAGPVAILVRRR